MAVTGLASRNDLAGDAVTMLFNFTFKAPDKAWVKVYVSGVPTSAMVALNADQDASPGGAVLFDAAPAYGATVRIQRETPKTQGTVYSAYDAFPAKTHEAALDRVTMQIQEVDRVVQDYQAEDPTALAVDAAASATVASELSTSSAVSAANSEGVAVASSAASTAAKTAAEAALAATLSAAAATRVYPDEPTGRAAVADGAYFYVPSAVVGEEKITYRRVNAGTASTEVSRSPSAGTLPALARGKNLFDKTAARQWFTMTATGAEVASSSPWKISEYIPVAGGAQVAVTKLVYLAEYDGNKVYVAGTYRYTANPGGDAAFTLNTASRYLRVVYHSVSYEATMQVEYGGACTAFAAFTPPTVTTPQGTPAWVDNVKNVPAGAALASDVALVPAIAATFDVVIAKNKYNPALAVNGQIYAYVGGAGSAFANSAITGRIPVVEGKTYTLSMPTTESGFLPHVFCWNAGGAYLGMDALVSGNPVIAGMGLVAGSLISGGYHTLTFTVPIGSGVASVGTTMIYPYAAHVTGDFDRIRNAVMLEEGSAATPFSAYGLNYAAPKAVTPPVVAAVSEGTVRVTKAGNLIYIRTRWSDASDLVQLMTMQTGAVWTANDVVNFSGAALIPIATADAAVAAAFAAPTQVLAIQGDETAPVNYNGTFIGANHGPFVAFAITAAAHGKTQVDVGSEWTDGVARKWYIVRIVDANTLWVVSENLGTATLWSFAVAISGATLTHSSGATNTGAITFSAPTQTQWYPIAQNKVKSVLLDGRTTVTIDGTYAAGTVDVTESYDIANVASALAYVRGTVGGAVEVYPNAAAIASQFRLTLVNRFAPNGSCTVYHAVRAYQDVTLSYIGFVQQSVLTFAGKTLLAYVPRVNAIVGGVKTWSLAATEDITTQIESLELTVPTWSDANNPPDRMAQIVKNGANREFGYVLGYSPLRGIGVPATRKTLVNTAGNLYSSRKMYPKGLTGGSTAIPSTLAAGSYYEAVAYRCFFNSAVVPEATVFAWFWDGQNAVVLLDFHANVTAKRIPLPSYFAGRQVSVIDKSASFSLIGGEFVSPDGLYVTVTGGYGYAVLKLAP